MGRRNNFLIKLTKPVSNIGIKRMRIGIAMTDSRLKKPVPLR